MALQRARLRICQIGANPANGHALKMADSEHARRDAGPTGRIADAQAARSAVAGSPASAATIRPGGLWAQTTRADGYGRSPAPSWGPAS